MAITQIRGAQVLDASITEDDLNASVAGVGISGAAGTPLALDFSELSAAVIDVANDEITIVDATDSSSKKESVADLMTGVAGAGLTATSGVLAVLVDSAEITSGAVDVDHLSDLRVSEGTGLVADVAAGTIRVDDGSTVTVVSISAGTITVTDADVSFVEVDSSGTVSDNTVGFTQGRIPLAEVTAVAGDITVVTDKRAWLDIDPGATGLVDSNFVTREVPTGDLDGVDVTYVLANTPTAGTEEAYLNGILQNVGAGNDYTISGATITFAAAPISTDVVLVSYRK